MKTSMIFFISSMVSFPLAIAMAADCSSYPYTSGMSVSADSTNIPKIVSTASVSVSQNDVDAVNDARDEATLTAKAMISKFLGEQMKSEETIKKVVADTKSMQGNDKRVERQEVTQRLKVLSDSSQNLLTGVIQIGDCYTPGLELRVSVGVKRETLAAALKAAGAMSGADSSAEPGQGQTGSRSGSQGPTPVPGYSNSNDATKF